MTAPPLDQPQREQRRKAGAGVLFVATRREGAAAAGIKDMKAFVRALARESAREYALTIQEKTHDDAQRAS